MQNRRDERVEEIETVVAIEVWVDGEPAGPDTIGDEAAAAPDHRGADGPVVLTGEEAELLGRVLTSYLGDLRMEIADTDNPAMRRDLHREEDSIRALLTRLPVP
jgi:hypothetical protein